MPVLKQHFIRLHRRRTNFFPELAATDVAKPMSDELDRLARTIPRQEPLGRKAFVAEMQSFLDLYRRHRSEFSGGSILDWNKVSPLSDGQMLLYNNLPSSNSSNLNKLVVLKVNGGLGSTMGMNGAKSSLEIQNNLTFLDLIIQQVEDLNISNKADVPLLLMTSFNTAEDTLRIVKKYANRQIKITTFNQSRYPRIQQETLVPFAKSVNEPNAAWYPPGHGDLYLSLYRSGVLDRLLANGKEYIFVSNSDNLGATVDQRILQHMVDTQSEFVMEVTNKTKTDIQGGTLINYDGSIRLLEMSQIPEDITEEFTQSRSFKLFNTNNLWLNIRALKRVMHAGEMPLDIICKRKTLDDGRNVFQLETTAGSAIKHFHNAHGIHVPRNRFLPVKDCSDLLLVRSDVFTVDHGCLVMDERRMFGIAPVVKLGGHFKKIHQFQKRFKQIPHMVDLDHLTVAGDVYFGRNVTLRGTIIIMANEGQRIDIPDGCVLENRLVSGNLNMIEL